MDTTAKNPHALRGEWMLALAVCINSFGVVLMLYSGHTPECYSKI